jgi:hypothetical protein
MKERKKEREEERKKERKKEREEERKREKGKRLNSSLLCYRQSKPKEVVLSINSIALHNDVPITIDLAGMKFVANFYFMSLQLLPFFLFSLFLLSLSHSHSLSLSFSLFLLGTLKKFPIPIPSSIIQPVTNFMRTFTGLLGIIPGKEFIVAKKEAEKQGAKVVYADKEPLVRKKERKKREKERKKREREREGKNILSLVHFLFISFSSFPLFFLSFLSFF